MMEFSKFRESADLSDITVTVSSKEHKLHKFPLFAKSDYFCELARSRPVGDVEPFKVALDNFPGGSDTFEQVADFCYNMSLNLNKNNVIAIRCAAEYLKMFGPGNLKDVSSKFLMDTISSAKVNRLTTVVVSMLMDCNSIGDMAEETGLVNVCLEAFIECWVKPSVKYSVVGSGRSFFKTTPQSSEAFSAFTRLYAPSGQQTDKLDEFSINNLLALRPDWFALLLTKAGIKGASYEELGNLTVKYISSALDKELTGKADQSSKDELNNLESSDEKDIDTNNSAAVDELFAATDLNEKKVQRVDTPTASKVKFDIGTVLDKVVLALTDEAFNIPAVTLEWLKQVIPVATLHGCECRGKLARVAGEMLTKLDPKELCSISPSVLHDIVVDANDEKDETKTRMSSDRACRLVDMYMDEMAKEGTLTAEAFRLLASATKNYNRTSHDLLYNVLVFVLKLEKDNLTHEQRTELTEFVNFDLLSETNLQNALDKEIGSTSKIAHSAIKLCTRLRSELASVNYIAEIQVEDIQKYQTPTAKPTKESAIDEFQRSTLFPYGPRNADLDCTDRDDQDDTSSLEAIKSEDPDTTNNTDPFTAAQNVLIAARHRLNLPVYTGYRPVFLSRLSPPTYGGHVHSHNYNAQREHDISLEDELEYRFDRPFHSLDPRARHRRLVANQLRMNADSGQRTYFPYSSHSHRL